MTVIVRTRGRNGITISNVKELNYHNSYSVSDVDRNKETFSLNVLNRDVSINITGASSKYFLSTALHDSEVEFFVLQWLENNIDNLRYKQRWCRLHEKAKETTA